MILFEKYFIPQLNIPAFGFSPIRNTRRALHGHDEFVYADGYLEGINIYRKIISNVAKIWVSMLTSTLLSWVLSFLLSCWKIENEWGVELMIVYGSNQLSNNSTFLSLLSTSVFSLDYLYLANLYFDIAQLLSDFCTFPLSERRDRTLPIVHV